LRGKWEGKSKYSKILPFVSFIRMGKYSEKVSEIAEATTNISTRTFWNVRNNFDNCLKFLSRNILTGEGGFKGVA
jgi:hypothetical protein